VLVDIHVSSQQGWTVLAPVGDLDLAGAPRLRQQVHRVAPGGEPRLIVDLSEVDFVDSTGLGVLIGVLKRVRTQGGQLRLAGAQPSVHRVVELVGLDRVFETYPDVAAAIDGVADEPGRGG